MKILLFLFSPISIVNVNLYAVKNVFHKYLYKELFFSNSMCLDSFLVISLLNIEFLIGLGDSENLSRLNIFIFFETYVFD